MLNKIKMSVLMLTLAGCQLSPAPAYQENREPEDRTEYNGIEGTLQQQKDQGYLMDKALVKKCDSARIELAIAKTAKNKAAIEESEARIRRHCK